VRRRAWLRLSLAAWLRRPAMSYRAHERTVLSAR
jgi:hypothetical protein